jgi:hypothetical protein
MRDGIIENQQDARWINVCGRMPWQPCDVFVDGLTDVALWLAYELSRCPSNDDIKVSDDGFLVILLQDDYHPPGWYHYKRRADSDDAARQLVREKFGDVVTVPLGAMLSERKVGA